MKEFDFDYWEKDRKSWIISHLCIRTDKILSKVLLLMLSDKKQLSEIQNKKTTK